MRISTTFEKENIFGIHFIPQFKESNSAGWWQEHTKMCTLSQNLNFFYSLLQELDVICSPLSGTWCPKPDYKLITNLYIIININLLSCFWKDKNWAKLQDAVWIISNKCKILNNSPVFFVLFSLTWHFRNKFLVNSLSILYIIVPSLLLLNIEHSWSITTPFLSHIAIACIW